jgi:hypothetical protein
MSHLARVVLGLLALCVVLSAPHAADAAIKTASIGVSAIVVDTCNIAVSRVAVTGSARCMMATPYRVMTSSASANAYPMSNDSGSTASSSHVKTQNTDTRVMVTTFVF